MVKSTFHIGALLRLIRWPNLIIVALTQILIWCCIITPLLRQVYMEPRMPFTIFIMVVLATVFISAGGYIINDYFDRKIDRVNKPGNVIIGTLIYPRHAMAYHFIFSISGIILGVLASIRSDHLYLSLIFFMVSGLLWFYSTTYKRDFLLGNIIVALLTAMVPFLILLFEMPLLAKEYGSSATPVIRILLIWVVGFSLFAFLLNLAREVVKDIEDLEGDHAYGKRTIPVMWGIITARWISITLIALVLALLTIAWLYFIHDYITLIYFLVMFVIPLLMTVYLLIKGGNQAVFHKASLLIKLVMLTGLGYMIVANLLINHFK